jgi:hypothetical protein
MEVTTPLGFHVASFALSGESVAYAITRQKRYAKGPVSPDAMKDLIHISLDPNIIINLLFDRPLPRAQWDCKVDVNQLPETCVSREGDLKITWSERHPDKRLVQIEAPKADVTMSLNENQSKVRISDAVFELPMPAGFKSVRLQ